MIKQIIEAYYDKDYVPPKPVIVAKPDEILSGISDTADTAE